MKELKSKLHYLKTKIFQHSEIPYNVKLELSNDMFKIEQALNIHGVVESFYCDCIQPSMQKPISDTEYECFDCGKEVKQ